MLRAPHNPSHFAVLVPEREAARILASEGSFTVTVKRPTEQGAEFTKDKSTRPRRSIIYEGGR
ncbi:MAG: hypothetical protein HC902_01165 [Calothrix sp. SM1_5_4]|nr:hypothetical protein [Calothrix sp. SM1_5_4]